MKHINSEITYSFKLKWPKEKEQKRTTMINKTPHKKQWGQTMIYKTLHKKQWGQTMINKTPHKKQWGQTWLTKHYTKNSTMSNRNRTKHREWSHVPRKGKQFLLHPYILYCCLFCIVCIRFFLNMASLLRNKIHSPQRCRIKETNKVYETHKVIQNQRWL